MHPVFAIALVSLLAAPAWAGRDRTSPGGTEVRERPVLHLRVLLADGSPAIRAAVTVDGLARGRTDALGRFTYEGLGAGQVVMLGVATTEAGPPESALITVTLAPGSQEMPLSLVPEAPAPARLAVRAEAPATVEGASAVAAGPAALTVWALDHTGRALPGAVVTLNGARAGETAEDGALSVPPQRPGRSVTVRVEAPMRLPVTVDRFVLAPGRQARTVVLMPRDTDGDQIPDLYDDCPDAPEVRNGYADDDGCPDRLGELSVLVLDPDRHPLTGAALTLDGASVGVTGPDGRRLLSGLLPQSRVAIEASVEDPMLAPGRLDALEVVEGDQSATVVLARSSLATSGPPALSILALDAAGAPVALATVVVEDSYRGRTDRDGRFVYTGRPAGTEVIVGVSAPFRDRDVSALRLVRLEGGPQAVRFWLDGSDGGVGALAQEDPDGDGRIDAFDQCPHEPETKNGYKDEDGCPDALARVLLEVVDTEGAPVRGASVAADGVVVGRTRPDGTIVLPESIPGQTMRVDVDTSGLDVAPGQFSWRDLVEGEQARRVVLSVLDADADGIRDSLDACPTEPETPNGYRDEDGCPDKLATLFLTVVDTNEARVAGAVVWVGGVEVGRTDGEGWAELADLAPGDDVDVEVRTATNAARIRVDLIEGAQRRRVLLVEDTHAVLDD